MARKMKLQEKDREIFKFILLYKGIFDGNSPSLREICQQCEVSSTSVARDSLHRLQQFGHIKLTPGKRGIFVAGGIWTFTPGVAFNA